jgi:hypothetical protein
VQFFHIIAYLATLVSIGNWKLANPIPHKGAMSFLLQVPRRWMASWCNHFRVCFISLALSFKSGMFLYHSVACDISFDWLVKLPNPILYEGPMTFLLQAIAFVGAWLFAPTTFGFSSSL